MKKLTKADILKIRPGCFEVFVFDTGKAILSAKSYISQLAKVELPDGIQRYRTKSNLVNKTLVVEAVPSE